VRGAPVTWSVDPGRYEAAPDFAGWLATVQKNAELWQAVHRTATVDEESVARLRAVPGRWRLLALSEDWCTDAVSTLPVIARLASRAGVELRVLARDANPDVMDAHLTRGTRSIPIVMVLDEAGVRWGWWGPRPVAVHRWMLTEGLWLPRDDRTRRKRAWYARDRGRGAVMEMAAAVERAARRRAEAPAS
jgi:hypothetical protein